MPTFKRTNEWKKWLDKGIKASIELGEDIIEETAEVFRRRVEKKTPIGDPSLWKYEAPPGYKPGTLKTSWNLDKQSRGGEIKTVMVYNTAPYAAVVEQGWSTQAPAGMMRVTIKEVPDIMAKIARRKK